MSEAVVEEKVPVKSKVDIEAVLNIYSSYNNTIVHLTDMSGKSISRISGGMMTKQDRLKANPTVAMFIAKKLIENMKELKINNLYVRIRAKTNNPSAGPGPHAILKSISREGIKVVNILDMARVPRGGPKKKGGRRGRRP